MSKVVKIWWSCGDGRCGHALKVGDLNVEIWREENVLEGEAIVTEAVVVDTFQAEANLFKD